MIARFEIVRTDAGWHSRYRASNGRVVWTTEVYTRRRAAASAITAWGRRAVSTPWPYAVWHPTEGAIEVRDVDEREPEPVLCPECAQGKVVNCALVAMDPSIDDFVPCANARAGR